MQRPQTTVDVRALNETLDVLRKILYEQAIEIVRLKQRISNLELESD